MLSTAVGEFLDSCIFITIAFIGEFPVNIIITMICCQVGFKILYEFISYPITRKVVFALRKVDDGELKGQI